MSALLEKLEGWGCDTKLALERFVDDEDLYKECLDIFCTDEGFGRLGNAIEEENHEAIFDEAHALKGVSANLELSPIYEPIAQIVADIRAERYDRFDELYQDVLKNRDDLVKLIEE